MKLSATDKAYISEPDARVVACGGGFPRGCRILDLQIFSATVDRTITYHRASPWQRKSICLKQNLGR